MRSPLRTLARSAPISNKTPVPFASRYTGAAAWWRPGGVESQMRAMGWSGDLFAIVDRLATSFSSVEWHLYREGQAGQKPEERQEVTKHLALDLWRRPNKFYTGNLFRETYGQHYELVGEGWWVMVRDARFKHIPLEMWPVPPHRIEPIPDRDEYLIGYMYHSPDGEQIALDVDQVIQIRRPNPIDPYRGIGPVQTIMADLEGVALSAEWNRNFFLNSAEPGGIIEYDKKLSDRDYRELRDRWREQHRGVANAHRVAIIEAGKWVDRKYTNRDMQFAELRAVGSDVIRKAFGIDKFSIGQLDDINRATAEAAMVWFARQMTVPRLDRTKDVLNHHYLPLFGPTGEGLEWDYENPVDEDRELAYQELKARSEAAKNLSDIGYYPPEILPVVGLPDMSFGQPDADEDRELLVGLVKGAPTLAPLILPLLGIELPEQPAPPVPPVPEPAPEPAPPAVEPAALGRPRLALPAVRVRVRAAADLSGVRQDLEDALAAVESDWAPITDAWIDDLVDQVQAAVDDDDVTALSALGVDSADAGDLLRDAVASMAQTAADRMADEAADQGVDVTAPRVDKSVTATAAGGRYRFEAFGAELADIAITVATMIGTDLAGSAGREALRLFVPGIDAEQVAGKVKGYLKKLKGVLRRDKIGAVLHRATNVGRLATLEVAPKATYYASEINDRNTCTPCEEIDGHEFSSLAAADGLYAAGSYLLCEGGDRCRGTVEAVWEAP